MYGWVNEGPGKNLEIVPFTCIDVAKRDIPTSISLILQENVLLPFERCWVLNRSTSAFDNYLHIPGRSK